METWDVKVHVYVCIVYTGLTGSSVGLWQGLENQFKRTMLLESGLLGKMLVGNCSHH